MRRWALVAYDIASDRDRSRAHARVLQYRVDGQYSAHLCPLTEHEADELLLDLATLIDPCRDRVLLAWIDQRGSEAGLRAGFPPLPPRLQMY
ncbi:MAG: CRISPR-associated endonuclease Cas2 [Xanthomonadales bacterium]|jgi:CRISPR/Cas system-associated endoribonuclease Cas2|nr:CRISPR-associated endonuclease Cas2 [Xanthomonadales bacterium]